MAHTGGMERRKYKIQPAEVWDKVRQDYLAGLGAEEVAAKYDVTTHALRARATRDGWSRYLHAPAEPVDPPPPPPSLFDVSSDDAAGGDPAVLAEAAAQASGRAMRAGRLLEARALAGLAATYRKLEARGETAHGAMTVENAPLQLVYDILMNPLAASDRLAIRPGAADTHLALKEAYWTQQQTLGQKNQEFRHAQLHRRAALDRRVAALEDQLKAAGMEPVAETESARRIRTGVDMVIDCCGKVMSAKDWDKTLDGL